MRKVGQVQAQARGTERSKSGQLISSRPRTVAQQCARRLCPSSSIHCILSNPAAATMHAMLLCMALGLVVAEDATDMLGWQPPKCASWCKFSDTNCNKDMCSGCDACLDMPPASPPAPGGGASSGSLAPGLCGAGCAGESVTRTRQKL